MKFLKVLWIVPIVFAISSPLMAAPKDSDLEGFKTPQDAINAFINPLKQGSKGIAESMKAAKSLNGESMNYANNSLQNGPKYGQTSDVEGTLRRDIKENGKVEKATMVDSYSRLNGHMQTYEYELKYVGGKKRTVTITVIKPTMNGGYQVMGVKADE